MLAHLTKSLRVLFSVFRVLGSQSSQVFVDPAPRPDHCTWLLVVLDVYWNQNSKQGGAVIRCHNSNGINVKFQFFL